jgi:Bacterial sugar transferase
MAGVVVQLLSRGLDREGFLKFSLAPAFFHGLLVGLPPPVLSGATAFQGVCPGLTMGFALMFVAMGTGRCPVRCLSESPRRADWRNPRARERDLRITRIRATRIDELPRLINVARCEMGIIGSYTERPAFVKQLAKIILFHNHRFFGKPALTGPTQVNFLYREGAR